MIERDEYQASEQGDLVYDEIEIVVTGTSEPVMVLNREVGVTIIKKESNPDGVTVGFLVIGGEEMGGGEQGGHPSFGPPPTPIPDPTPPPTPSPRGVVEVTGVETTVVEETSESTTTPSGVVGGTRPDAGTPAVTDPPPAPSVAPGPGMGSHPPLVIRPGDLTFRDHGHSWMSQCVEVRLVLKINGVPVTTPVSLGLRAFVRKEFATGMTVDIFRAQIITATAAAEAAAVVSHALDVGLVSIAQVPDRFRAAMDAAYRANLHDAHVEPC